MTQKGQLFKGQQKRRKKNAAAGSCNLHGKVPILRKGKLFKPPVKASSEFNINKEVGKFINQANEAKAAAVATKEGAKLRLLRPSVGTSRSSKD